MTPASVIIIFVLAVLLQGLFAGYETGFVSTNPIRIRYMAEEERLSRAARLLRHMHRPDRMLTTLLLGTNVAIVMGTIALAREVGDLGAMLIATPVFLIFAEIVPKSIFRKHPNRLSLALLPTIHFFYVALAPLAVPVSGMTRLLMRLVGHQEKHISPFMSSLEDVRILVDESAAHGNIEREEQRMIHSVIDLHTTQANEIMVPRIDIQALPDTATRGELLALFVQTGCTRIPVYHETIDKIIGVVNSYDVMLDLEPENEDITRFIAEVIHVPDSMRVDDLFKALKAAKQHVAIVVDEYGGTDGLVTLEDIFEEIFGEIQDEHDYEERPIYQVGTDAYVIDARTSLEEVEKVVGVAVRDEEVETAGGWVMHMAGRIPTQGEVINHGDFKITILDGGPNYITKVRLELRPEARKTDDIGKDRAAT
ncbi:MAG: HlyC/CorC family transporter [Candidatus Hydrogenedentes bacterium]|nr:HlyC/CorC family transporter [Candidatus Hydrogenedentota bacterium]